MRLSICLFIFQKDYIKNTRLNVMDLGRKMEHSQRKNPLNFAVDTDHCLLKV